MNMSKIVDSKTNVKMNQETMKIDSVKASVHDRMEIECEMQKQRTNSMADPYFSHPAPKPATIPRISSHSRYSGSFQRPQVFRHSSTNNRNTTNAHPAFRTLRDIEESLARAGFFDEFVSSESMSMNDSSIDDVSMAEELMILEVYCVFICIYLCICLCIVLLIVCVYVILLYIWF